MLDKLKKLAALVVAIVAAMPHYDHNANLLNGE